MLTTENFHHPTTSQKKTARKPYSTNKNIKTTIWNLPFVRRGLKSPTFETECF